ncbi:hypothetical protein AVEN_59157-1 [Araneus ventricosus]|uniref:Uncharacterized protein n=1 Tax=Araneus ventricosus TaxID=182803 RepID=A0A4Y2PBC8_ARAVE|nr:hypothetical protein AVEN_59157-1 [Araneus ventricosus]
MESFLAEYKKSAPFALYFIYHHESLECSIRCSGRLDVAEKQLVYPESCLCSCLGSRKYFGCGSYQRVLGTLNVRRNTKKLLRSSLERIPWRDDRRKGILSQAE